MASSMVHRWISRQRTPVSRFDAGLLYQLVRLSGGSEALLPPATPVRIETSRLHRSADEYARLAPHGGPQFTYCWRPTTQKIISPRLARIMSFSRNHGTRPAGHEPVSPSSAPVSGQYPLEVHAPHWMRKLQRRLWNVGPELSCSYLTALVLDGQTVGKKTDEAAQFPYHIFCLWACLPLNTIIVIVVMLVCACDFVASNLLTVCAKRRGTHYLYTHIYIFYPRKDNEEEMRCARTHEPLTSNHQTSAVVGSLRNKSNWNVVRVRINSGKALQRIFVVSEKCSNHIARGSQPVLRVLTPFAVLLLLLLFSFSRLTHRSSRNFQEETALRRSWIPQKKNEGSQSLIVVILEENRWIWIRQRKVSLKALKISDRKE
eukprot:gene9590-6743_t